MMAVRSKKAYRYFLNFVALLEKVNCALELSKVLARAVLLDFLLGLDRSAIRVVPFDDV
jgi:hypothetical protein